MLLNPYKTLIEWYHVGFAYSGQMLPLFAWTLVCFIACAAFLIHYILKGKIPTVLNDRVGFVAVLGLAWSIHLFVVYLSFIVREYFNRASTVHMSESEFTKEVLIMHRATTGMALFSTLLLLLATCVVLRGNTQQHRVATMRQQSD